LDDLDQLKASIRYAKVPDSYWKSKAKEMLGKVAGKAPDAAIDIAASYLKLGS
jgi:hypothetical protein